MRNLLSQYWRAALQAACGSWKCRKGVTTIVVAIALPSLILAGLLTTDIACIHLAKERLQTATDAATLAGAVDMGAQAPAEAMRQVFEANFPSGYLGTEALRFEPVVTTSQAGVDAVTLTAELSLPSLLAGFLRGLGFEPYRLTATATAERRTRGAELALVLDNTGSMSGQPIKDLRAAAQSLIDTIFAGKPAVPNLYVSLVPYVASVNIGRQHAGWLASPLASYAPTSWKGCVMARPAPYDQTDDPPSRRGFEALFWPPSIQNGTTTPYHAASPNVWPDAKGQVDERQAAGNKGYGPNLGCGPPVVPLTPSYAVISAGIAKMEAWSRGGTMANLGLVWGWRTLSPQWRGWWRQADGAFVAGRPLDYGYPGVSKLMVLMTDGVNQWYQKDLTAYGRPDANTLGGETIDSRMLKVCEAIKRQSIVLFTITFGSSVTAATRDLFTRCASSETQDPSFPGQKYFHSPSGADLKRAFANIAGQITSVRLAR